MELSTEYLSMVQNFIRHKKAAGWSRRKGAEMPINSKQKGKRFELELSRKFREYGYTESRRTAQYCGNTGDASDVVGLPGIHVEAKHQERMQLYDWMDQAKRDAAAGKERMLPTVFSKKNNCKILVTMELDDWFEIYREYESGMELRTAQNPEFWGDGCDKDGKIILDQWKCPRCGENYEVDFDRFDYCPGCGQKIKWEEDK